MKKTLSIVLVLVLCLTLLTACGSKQTKTEGVSYTPVSTMADALLEVKSGTATCAVVDYVMARSMVGAGTDYADLMILEGVDLAAEEYAIGFRNGSTAVDKINEAIDALAADGTLAKIAEKYDQTYALIADPVPSPESGTSDEDDWAYIQGKGSLVIGITEYAPMNYYDDDGTLIGFDTEFAQAVCEYLGIKAEFTVIEWETKEIELSSKTIDCIWNGLTVDTERMENMDFSSSYMINKQCLVVKNAAFVAEAGSAGEGVVQDVMHIK